MKFFDCFKPSSEQSAALKPESRDAREKRTRPTALKATAAIPKILSLAELREADFPKPIPIVEHFLHEGETVAFIGRPKMGKSLLMQQLALSATRGEPFLGRKIQGPQRVFYLDLENRFPFVKERFGRMSSPHDLDANLGIYSPGTLADQSLTLGSTDGLSNLRKVLEQFRPSILFVDPWRLFCGGDESKVEQVVKALREVSSLREILPKMGIVVVHHLRKNQGESRVKLRLNAHDWVEEASGSYSFIGHCDATFGLDREREGNEDELIVLGGIARNFSADPLLLTHDEETLRFAIAAGEELLLKLLTGAEGEYWQLAKARKSFTHGDLVEARPSTNKGALSGMLKKARNQGLIEQMPDKSYRLIEQQPGKAKAA